MDYLLLVERVQEDVSGVWWAHLRILLKIWILSDVHSNDAHHHYSILELAVDLLQYIVLH